MDYKLVILLILALESILGAAYIFFKKDNIAYSVSILAVFLLTLGLIFLESFIINYFGYDNPNPLIVLYSYLFFVFCLFLPPTFYFYNLSLVNEKSTIIKENNVLSHYFPAICLLIVNLFSFVALYTIAPETPSYVLLQNVLIYSNFISLFFVFLLQNVYYLFRAWMLYRKEKTILKEAQSKESNITLQWMKGFILSYTLLIAMLYVFQLRPLEEGKLIFRIFTLIYVSFIIYFGKNNYQFILENIKSDILDNKKREEIKTNLLTYMTKEKPFLDYDLTVQSLAHSIGTNSKYLSYLINKEFDCNFSSFINNYRIKEAQSLLSDPQYHIYTIESIAKMTGFKSKSTFNSSFKKQTLLTPSQFKMQFKEG